jgi:hypothetical protein
MLGGLSLLLPLTAAAESHPQTQAANAGVVATAHVNFKIVIPQVLYLRTDADGERHRAPQNVAVMTNSHTVSLTASARNPAAGDAPHNVILSSPARKVIAQDAVCGPLNRAHAAGSTAPSPVVCTVSMP